MILSLVIGVAGGYAAFRFTQPGLLTQQDSSAPHEDANAEITRLNDALSVAMNDLEDARAAQAASAAEVEELKAQTARQAADLDAMAEKLAAVSSETQPPEDNTAALEVLSRERDALTAENESLKSDLAALDADRGSLRQEAAEARSRLEAELARVNDQVVPDLTAERDRLQGRVLALLADRDALKAEVDAAAGSNTADVRRILELEAQLADSARELAAARAELAAREAGQTESPAVANPDINADPARPTAAAEAGTTPILTPRDPDMVATALRAAPGLGFLSTQDRQLLTDQLVAGECVTTALESVFDRVPILTLRNLIRDLNSDC
ncbi:MAG: hypothetical protein KUA43_01915 [Hoeflea sp.]|uniref:hypothetical protein n=1 Tax=Hoeflea sp. TaxID=1940281 RepID=UPI001D427D4B|nr:hypothetical protein [Hoeflea sp.]MBU4530629.1 hypothetical protein [Alphaproteobacteria bacterium]MBU4544849.1 hypothetical protein [Alphaproteobacteria bacterium]MBU4551992.1 hypothetical protein [Alphaproteobacteria bacterium]MBV1722181.1 hypothetical protein [Hoeflea sp.]MBV1761743.1 hypothetical protein [Hoeflea sp.]